MSNRIQLYALPVLSLPAAPGPAVLHLDDFQASYPLQGYAWLFCTARQAGWTLIDTGADNLTEINMGRPVERRWKANPIVDLLSCYGLAPSDIRNVILTHLHWDHIGNIELFCDAEWYVPEKEWSFVSDPANRDVLPDPLFPQKIVDLLSSKNPRLVKDGESPIPNLRLRHLGGHSPGCAAIDVTDESNKTRLVLGGDVIPLYENLHRQIPPGTLWSYPDCIRALKQLLKISSTGIPVLPGHDPKILEHYPSGIILDER